MSLSLLPTELLELVSSHIDLPTFQSLRLTSCHLRSSTVHIFKHRFFTIQHLTWTKASLQRLLDISTNEDLGTALQNLIIDATPHYALSLWKMRRRSSDAGHFTPTTDDEDGIKLIQRLNREYLELSAEAEGAAKWFNETRFDVKCLTTVFTRLTSLSSITFAYTGMEARYSKFGRRYCEASQHEMSRPFISTLSAIAASNLDVKRLELSKGKDHGAISIGRLESLAPSLLKLSPALERLDTLHLNLRDWRTPDTGFELDHPRAPFVIRFLAKCTDLKTLHLSCYSSFESDLFEEMARTCHFEKLEVCRLEMWRIERAGDLLALLESMKGSLRELELKHVLLADRESTWAELFTCLANSTSCLAALETLEVERLFAQRANGSVKGVLFHDLKRSTSSLKVEGEGWRDNLKDRGCRYVEPESAKMWEVGATMYPFRGVDSKPCP